MDGFVRQVRSVAASCTDPVNPACHHQAVSDVMGYHTQSDIPNYWAYANNFVLLRNDLEDRGYVERRRDPADRRRHVVVLTDEGRDALERAEEAQESLGEEMFAALSDEDRATLRSLLSRVVEPAAGR